MALLQHTPEVQSSCTTRAPFCSFTNQQPSCQDQPAYTPACLPACHPASRQAVSNRGCALCSKRCLSPAHLELVCVHEGVRAPLLLQEASDEADGRADAAALLPYAPIPVAEVASALLVSLRGRGESGRGAERRGGKGGRDSDGVSVEVAQ